MTLCTFGPPDERKRRWILKFEDADVGDMHFASEPDAMRAFDRYSGAFTCTLFVTATFVQPEKREPVYLREVDTGTDNACWVVCAKGDPGALRFEARS